MRIDICYTFTNLGSITWYLVSGLCMWEANVYTKIQISVHFICMTVYVLHITGTELVNLAVMHMCSRLYV